MGSERDTRTRDITRDVPLGRDTKKKQDFFITRILYDKSYDDHISVYRTPKDLILEPKFKFKKSSTRISKSWNHTTIKEHSNFQEHLNTYYKTL